MYRVSRYIQMLTYWPVYLALRFLVRYDVKGREHLGGLEGRAVIFASNHASYIDGPISAVAMPRRKGQWYPKEFFPLRFLVLDRFFQWRYLLMALYVWLNGSIKVVRYGGDLRKSLAETIEALRGGQKVWIYPEGRLTPDGTLQEGKRGVAYLHRETGAPVVPVGISGSFGILSFRTLLGKNRVTVAIGAPMGSLDNPGSTTLEEGATKVMAAIQGLLTRDGRGCGDAGMAPGTGRKED